MEDVAQILLGLGSILLLGLAADALGRRTPLPRVTLLLIFGFIVGPSGLDFLSTRLESWFPVVADIALVMVGFLLGEQLTMARLREHGRQVVVVSLVTIGATALTVGGGLWLVGAPAVLCLLLAGIATATAPAATLDVIHELKADGPFTRTVLGVVAVDDAWGLMAFSILLAVADSVTGQGVPLDALLHGARDIGGGLLVGLALGFPMAQLTGRISRGEPTLVEALGLVLVCGGLCLWIDVSFLLAAMAMGATVANVAKHHTRPFHAIEGIEWPFMVLFFVLAGALLDLSELSKTGIVGIAYLALRTVARLVGGWVGVLSAGGRPQHARAMGLALMPQAGVAIGMVLIATSRFPKHAEALFAIVLGATAVFELIGPICCRFAIKSVGEGCHATSADD